MFYMTLPSNSSMGVFPNNTITHYTTQLTQAIRLTGEWECGLVALEYPHSWFNIQKDEVYIKLIAMVHDSGDTMHRVTLPAGYYPTPKVLAKALNNMLVQCKRAELYDLKMAVRFTFDESRQVFQLWFNKAAQLALSPRLQELLGVDFRTMTIQPSDDPHEGEPNPRETPDSGLQALYVYCDLVESGVVGDTLAPLLRTVSIDHRNNGNQVSREFQHIQYLPIQKKEFTTVEIDIRDDYGRLVPFTRGKAIVTLHFRRRRAAHFT